MIDDVRYRFTVLMICLMGFILIFKLFNLQVLKYDFYKEAAAGQHQTYQVLSPKRGEIFIKDRFYKEGDSLINLFPVAINKEWKMIYAEPKNIKDPKKTTEILIELLDLERDDLRAKLEKKNDPYEPIMHKVPQETAQKIAELNLPGIKLASENWRFYPAKTFISHVLGFVGFLENDLKGQYGVEGYYDKILSGKHGYLEGEKDVMGRIINIAKSQLQPAQDGADLILTIDSNIQFFIEEKLKETIERLEAEGGTIIVEDPRTGEIKALANWPTFDPNNYSKVEDISIFLNPAIHNLFEPGSIFKPFTMAIALDKHLITPETTYEDKGYIVIDGHKIRNSHDKPEGVQTMTQVLEKSLNTGAIFVQQLIDKKTFKEYLEKFGFNKKTGIDLQGETTGNLANLNTKRDIEYATASFGQGIAITPIELIAGLSAFANKGKIMQPHVVEKIIFSNGKEKKIEPKLLSQPISSKTAFEVTKMMVSVVENGYGKKAGVEGYFIAGKTGTAQVPREDRRGYSDKTIHSFGGFFPAFDPRFVLLVKIDNPKGIRFAADSVAPVFREIAEYILNYYEISPTR